MPQTVIEYATAQKMLVVAAQSRFTSWFIRNYTPQNVRGTRDRVNIILPALVNDFGNASSMLAITWYDALRRDAGLSSIFSAAPYLVGPNLEWLGRDTYEALDPLFAAEPNPDEALKEFSDILDEYVQQAGRNTILNATRNDPSGARWVRVPSGRDSCAFCIALSGASYLSQESALRTGAGEKYHPNCSCSARPVFGNQFPEGDEALLQGYADIYRSAADAAGTSEISAVTAAMREQNTWITH